MPGASIEYPATSLPAVATVDWWPLAFRLRADREDVIRWFRHHLYSVSTPSPGDRPGRNTPLTAVVDAELAGSTYRAVHDGPVRRVDGYLGDVWLVGQLNGDQVWCGPASGPDAADRLVIVSNDLDGHTVIGADSGSVAAGCVRLARELLRMELARRGSLTVHASMAARRGRGGLLFIGGTGAGKTTLALTVARAGGYLVSIDQTEVLHVGASTHGVGFPWPARLGVGMLAGMGLDRAVETMPLLRPQKPIHDGRITTESRNFRSLNKIELSMLELDTVLGVLTLDRAPIHGVVLIETAPAGTPMRVESTTVEDAEADLLREFREPDPVFTSFWMTPPGQPPPPTGSFGDLCAGFRRLRLVRLTWRADQHSAAMALRDIDAVLDSEGGSR